MELAKHNIPRLEEKLAKLNRRAAKLGLEPFVLTILKDFTKLMGEKGSEVLVDYVEATLTGPIIKINGWEFIAKLELSDSGVVVYNINPGVEIPASIKQDAGECEHCHSARQRKDTFVLRHDSGEFKQVGRQCLKDYLGYHGTPEQILMLAQISYEVHNCNEPDEVDLMSAGTYRLPGKTFIVYSCAACRLYGYKNRAMVEESFHPVMTTGDAAWVSYVSKTPDELRKSITEEDQKQASDVCKWINALPGNNDYENNLKVLLNDGVSYFGRNILASAVPSYIRSTESSQKDSLINDYFGEIGKRKEMNLTFIGRSSFDTEFGIMSIMRFRSEDGKLAVWKTTSGWNKDVAPGCSCRVKATVKEHSEYKGFKQTILSRVTLL